MNYFIRQDPAQDSDLSLKSMTSFRPETGSIFAIYDPYPPRTPRHLIRERLTSDIHYFYNDCSLKISFDVFRQNISDQFKCRPVGTCEDRSCIKQLIQWNFLYVSSDTFSKTFVPGTLLFIRVGDWRDKLLCDYKKKWSLRKLFDHYTISSCRVKRYKES